MAGAGVCLSAVDCLLRPPGGGGGGGRVAEGAGAGADPGIGGGGRLLRFGSVSSDALASRGDIGGERAGKSGG